MTNKVASRVIGQTEVSKLTQFDAAATSRAIDSLDLDYSLLDFLRKALASKITVH